jgi:hypothetical protein
MERSNLRKLNDVDVREEYQVKIWNRFVAFENFDDDDDDDDDDDVDINRLERTQNLSHRVLVIMGWNIINHD